MSRRKSVPAYRLHKSTGQALVTLPDGLGGRKDFYLGAHGSAESRKEYLRLIQEWEATGRCLPPQVDLCKSDLTIAEVILAYWKWAEGRYVKEGKPTSELDTIRQALRFVHTLYGDTPAREFGPLSLKAVRNAMVSHKITRKVKQKDPETGKVKRVEKISAEGLSRRFINKQIVRIKSFFKWAVAEELVPAATYQALACVAGLRKGEGGTREKAPVPPVADHVVDATMPFLTPMVADIVRVQRLSGARPGEILQMRALDLDRSSDVWEFRPGRHKGEHHDRARVVFIGPQAQRILQKYSSLEMAAPFFRPDVSEESRNLQKRQSRKSPMTPSAKKRRARQKSRGRAGEQYTVAVYRRAIARACKKAGVPVWTPHQLRHTAATDVRKRFGLEAAQAVLGHAALGVTQVYAEKDLECARRVMGLIG